MYTFALGALVALQAFHVLFLSSHDWIPLGNLNDVKAVRVANPGSKLLVGTVISTIPFAFGLVASIVHFGKTYPGWLFWWLWMSYLLLFFGELKAWWIPYFFRPEPAKATRYEGMFGGTHAFLPSRTESDPIRCMWMIEA